MQVWLLVVVLLALLRVRPGWGASDVDLCVIGAGPSGVQASYAAEAKGYSTAIFEKNSFVGGKTKAVEHDGRIFPMGAVTDVRSIKRTSIDNLIRQFETPILQPNFPNFSVLRAPGVMEPLPLDWIGLTIAWLRYIFIRFALGALDEPDGYVEYEENSGLFVSTRQWLEERGMLPGIQDVVWNIMTCLGYGEIDRTPAIYFLKYFPAEFVVNQMFATILDFVNIGNCDYCARYLVYQNLLESMAQTLKGNVYLSTEISEVVYGDEENTIFYSVNGSNVQQTLCGSILIAFAPLPEAMELFIPPGDAGETLQSLSQQIDTVFYYSVLLQDIDNYFDEVGVYYEPIQEQVPDNPAKILMYLKVYEAAGTPVLAYYSSPSTKTEEQAKVEILASYNGHIGRTTVLLDESAILVFEPWLNYFPHATEEALQNGFYPKFDNLQGAYNQFYVGGLFTFETVEFSMEHARSIVDRFF